MVFQECPKCKNKLHPPLKSSGRQVCTNCGWTHKHEDSKIQSAKLTEPISGETQLTNEFDSESKIKDDPLSESLKYRRKIYQFIQLRVQLLGRGMTNEIMNVYVNGKRLHAQQKTLHDFLNYLGFFGFKVVNVELETEGVYTYFFTLQREVYTKETPSEDILNILNRVKEGADFGDSLRNFLEFSLLGDNF